MNKKIFFLISRTVFVFALLVFAMGCKDDAVNDGETPEDNAQTLYQEKVDYMNTDAAIISGLVKGELEVTATWTDDKGNRSVQFSNQLVTIVYAASNYEKMKTIPLLGVDESGNWVYDYYGEVLPLKDANGNAVSASDGIVPVLRLNKTGYWEYTLDTKSWNRLSDKMVGKIENAGRGSYSLFDTAIMSYDSTSMTLTLKTGGKSFSVVTRDMQTTEAWNKFNAGAEDNILLDFSYAGYKHGEEAAPDGRAWGFTEENIKNYMTDGSKYARDALNKILAKYKLNERSGNSNAKVLIYFPEGDYILHNNSDNTKDDSKTTGDKDELGNNTSHSIDIFGGNVIIKGAGRDKTRLIMETPNLPNNDAMYSSPVMISIRHNGFLPINNDGSYNTLRLSDVTADAAKGTFSIEVGNPSLFSKGEYVCLYLHDNDPELVDKELLPYKWESTMTNISTEGVQVEDIHMITDIVGNKITFKEPIMHEVEAKYNWMLMNYSHYENVGIEDLTFVGHAKADFGHHDDWEDDGAYKPLNLMRLVNSWIRRVDFQDISEAASIISCANVSAYDINILGNRGHAAIRSQGSSRVFIGKVTDRTTGPLADSPYTVTEGAGQYHACGVSKPSMGAVIWNVYWGDDACFEAHATQPRATLIDMCKGGFVQSRQGGDADQVPNHLNDLTIWNMCSTRTKLGGNGNLPANGEFDWWRDGWKYWKILPPIIVGFHGEPANFVDEQVKLDENNGVPVLPESLYEAQLKHRLKHVPAWLLELK
ncbi:DUF4955 domain-containing protein [Bacteroides caecigallinarum]|uniref:DUF4955 domain-containing protein n=1 Tax=Bacteroides caecigallinarum TaxID=1411144 RepID=UPI001F2962F5|nr:DUF4955 domain-containing protein [Bacteroides caecigallinarum]MCF2594272.1 DUF4955 domain-containing protein [Bacteroides caecigallinarum]